MDVFRNGQRWYTGWHRFGDGDYDDVRTVRAAHFPQVKTVVTTTIILRNEKMRRRWVPSAGDGIHSFFVRACGRAHRDKSEDVQQSEAGQQTSTPLLRKKNRESVLRAHFLFSNTGT